MLSHQLLQHILMEVRPLLGRGKVANYIPALADVEPNQLGMAIYTAEGQLYYAGDAQVPFSIQSISKAFTLALAMTLPDQAALWQRVRKEPSGQPFNSLVQLEFEQGIPRNPFINAGALVINDILASSFSSPPQELVGLLRRLANNPHIDSNPYVADSEYAHSARNSAIAYLMKAYGNFDNEVDSVLKNYFHACAIEMSCVDIARSALFLANQGQPLGEKPLLSPQSTRQINALLATSGLYDEAGDFAYRVGMPGKSGVGGGILAIVPHDMAICVWSPELNPVGNSLAGIAALELFSQRYGRSIF